MFKRFTNTATDDITLQSAQYVGCNAIQASGRSFAIRCESVSIYEANLFIARIASRDACRLLTFEHLVNLTFVPEGLLELRVLDGTLCEYGGATNNTSQAGGALGSAQCLISTSPMTGTLFAHDSAAELDAIATFTCERVGWPTAGGSTLDSQALLPLRRDSGFVGGVCNGGLGGGSSNVLAGAAFASSVNVGVDSDLMRRFSLRVDMLFNGLESRTSQTLPATLSPFFKFAGGSQPIVTLGTWLLPPLSTTITTSVTTCQTVMSATLSLKSLADVSTRGAQLQTGVTVVNLTNTRIWFNSYLTLPYNV